ncbi:MAG TPA: hypothetical protein VL178_10825 [Pseudomonas sp.]|nr:hypothetical protein [Pseudomonas sp.]
MESAQRLAAALEASAFGTLMRESAWLYPTVNLLHLLGLVLLLGAMLFLDLRLLGAARRLPLQPLYRWLIGFALAGLLIQLFSGFALFAADASPLLANPLLRLKILLVLLGIGNALLFRALHSSAIAGGTAVPPFARLQAGLSLGLWLSVMAAGRLLAYL